jgi:hypothetical protein
MALRTGYGTGAYTVGKYGLPQVYIGASAVSVTSVVSQADSERVRLAAAAAGPASSVTVSAQRIQKSAIADSSASTATAAGYTALAGAVADTVTASVSISYVRIRPFSAADSMASTVTQRDARYKWIPITSPSDTWTPADYRGN